MSDAPGPHGDVEAAGRGRGRSRASRLALSMAVGLAIGIGAGMFFLGGPKRAPPSPPPRVAEAPVPAPQVPAPAAPVPAPEPASVPPPEPVVPAATPPAPAETSAAPAPPEPAPAPAPEPPPVPPAESPTPAPESSEPVVPVPPEPSPQPPPEPPPAAPPAPPAREPVFPAGAFGVVVLGTDAVDVAAAAEAALAAAPGDPSSRVARLAFRAAPAGDLPPDARATVEVGETSVLLRSSVAPDAPLDERVDATPAVRVASAVLEGAALPAAGPRRAASVAALAALAAGDGAIATAVLAGGDDDEPGTRLLRAYAALATGRLDDAHATLAGLESHEALRPLARFLTGAALLADGNSNEARRDFRAVLVERPSLWPARLFQAFAEHRLGLDRAAVESYEAVLAVVPDRPEPALGRAAAVAKDDPEGALRSLREIAARRPEEAAAWAWIATIQGGREGEEATREEVAALVRTTSLRPSDAEGWGRLGLARYRLHERGGGVAALEASVEAYRQHAELSPTAGVAWFNLGAALHRLATARVPGTRDVAAVRARLSEAGAAYRRALAANLYGGDAAGALYNLAIVDLLLGRVPEARASLDAAKEADPTFPLAALERVALAIAERDAKAAAAALASLPAGVDPGDRALLGAAIAALEGRETDVRSYLSTAGTAADRDTLAPLARLLLVQGWPAAGRALLSADTSDPTRLALRVRASVLLFDDAAARRDLALLEASDRAAAERLRASDPDVRGLSPE